MMTIKTIIITNDENTNVGDDDNDLVPSQWQRYTDHYFTSNPSSPV